jgi:hypothetical protein
MEGIGRGLFKVYTGIYLEVLRKATRYLGQNGPSLSPPEWTFVSGNKITRDLRTPAGSSLRQHVHIQHTFSLNLNSVNQLIFVMVKYGVLFEVRTEFLNNI